MENEMPTFIDTFRELQLKISDRIENEDLRDFAKDIRQKSQQKTVQQSRDELAVEQSLGAKQVQHKGILIEKGIMEYCLNQNSEQQTGEVIGDCKLTERIEQKVQQRKEESVEQLILEAKYAQLKGILMEKGILQSSNNEIKNKADESREKFIKQMREEYVLQLSSNDNTAQLKEVLLEKGLMETITQSNYVPEMQPLNDMRTYARKDIPSIYTEKKVREYHSEHKMNAEQLSKGDEENIEHSMAKMINDINQFTENLESDPHHIDWQLFHSNLVKIHQYYLKDENSKHQQDQESETTFNMKFNVDNQKVLKDSELVNGLNQVESDIKAVMDALNKLIGRSKNLKTNIEGIEHKISSIDFKVEQFYSKHFQTLLNREQSYKDMIALQLMHKDIGNRLSQIELEMNASKTQLIEKGVENK